MICEEEKNEECCKECEKHWEVSEDSNCVCSVCGWEL